MILQKRARMLRAVAVCGFLEVIRFSRGGFWSGWIAGSSHPRALRDAAMGHGKLMRSENMLSGVLV